MYARFCWRSTGTYHFAIASLLYPYSLFQCGRHTCSSSYNLHSTNLLSPSLNIYIALITRSETIIIACLRCFIRTYIFSIAVQFGVSFCKEVAKKFPFVAKLLERSDPHKKDANRLIFLTLLGELYQTQSLYMDCDSL